LIQVEYELAVLNFPSALSRYDFVVSYTRGAKALIGAEIAKQPLKSFRLGKSAIRNGPRNVRRL